ncbi:exocyst complex component [Anaeramoeba flamelloides]|uniref:Exocyst complex component n=1 Tax=Anaeramoeba flamelloides TaxID=1746091 RepID=A0AAV7YEW6_9EUKA|nr:exocyst complex component [Anaeramoeba flamelloides]
MLKSKNVNSLLLSGKKNKMFLFEDIDWSKDLDKKLLLDDLIGDIVNNDKEVKDKDQLSYFTTHEYFKKNQDGKGRLKDLSTDILFQIINLTKDVEETEEIHKDNVEEFKDRFDTVIKKYSKFEDRISNIGATTTKIGRQLENIHKLKLRSTSAIELIKYFLHFREKQKKPSTPLFVSDRHLVERANVLIKLNNIAKELKGEKNIIATKSIQKSISELQKTMLSAFEDASFSQDHEEMKKYLEILLLFNDGGKCIKTFIRSRKTLFKEIKTDQANESNFKGKNKKKKKTIKKILNPNESSSRTLLNEQKGNEDFKLNFRSTQLDNFLIQLIEKIKEDYELVNKVFSNPVRVMSMLIEMSFEFIKVNVNESLKQQKLNEKRKPISINKNGKNQTNRTQSLEEIYLKTLYESYLSVLKFEKTLNYLKLGELNIYELIEKIFKSYKSDYLKTEKDTLNTRFSEMLPKKFYLYLDYKKTNFKKFQKDPNFQKIEYPTLDTSLQFIYITESAIERAILLSTKENLGDNIRNIAECLNTFLGESYLMYFIDVVFQKIKVQKKIYKRAKKKEPTFEFLTIIQKTNHIILKFEEFFLVTVLPILTEFTNSFSTIKHKKRELLTSIENKLSLGLQNLLENSVKYFQYLLKNQKKIDFEPKKKDNNIINITAACKKAVEFLIKVTKNIIKTVDGQNLKIFFSVFGNQIADILLNHYAKFKFNSSGALQLLQDLSAFIKITRKFKIPQVDEKFVTLREISNIFLVPPKNLNNLKQQSRLNELEFKRFIKCRSDYKSKMIGEKI